MLCKLFKYEIFSWFLNSWKGYLTKREDERSKVQMFFRNILRHWKNLLTEKIFSGKKHHIMKELVVTLTMAICLKNAVLIILLPSRKVQRLLTISCCQKNAVPQKRPQTMWNSFLTLTVVEKENLMKSSPMYCPSKETKRRRSTIVSCCFEPQMKQKEQFVSPNLNVQFYWTNNRQEHQSEFQTSPTHLMKNAESKIIINDMTKITVPDSSIFRPFKYFMNKSRHGE